MENDKLDIRLPVGARRIVDEYAQQNGVKASDVARDALKEYFASRGLELPQELKPRGGVRRNAGRPRKVS